MLNRHLVWIKTALCSVLLILLAVPAISQSFYGSLISVTQDAQGGVIPGATVVLTSVTRATGAVIGPLLIVFASLWIVRVPLAYGLAPSWGEDAIWWSFPIGSIVALVLGYAYYAHGSWKRIELMGKTVASG